MAGATHGRLYAKPQQSLLAIHSQVMTRISLLSMSALLGYNVYFTVQSLRSAIHVLLFTWSLEGNSIETLAKCVHTD